MVLQGTSQELSLNEKVKLSADPARVTLDEELVEHLTQGIVVQADWDGERGLRSREPEQKQQSVHCDRTAQAAGLLYPDSYWYMFEPRCT